MHRSFPGIEVPYVSAIVDLDGGGTLKGNLIDIDPDPEKIRLGMPVEVVYKDALGRKDREGNSYLSYFFQPAAARQEITMSDVYVVGIDMTKFRRPAPARAWT